MGGAVSPVIRQRPASSVDEARNLGVLRASPMPDPRSAEYRKRIALSAVGRAVAEPPDSSAAPIPIPKAKAKAKAKAKTKVMKKK